MLAIVACDQRPVREGIEGVRLAEGSLVRRCLAGDADAWRTLHQTHLPAVRALLRGLGVDAGDLDDACQEVFVRVYRYLRAFRGEATLKTWISRLCVTEARQARHRLRVAATVRQVVRHELAANPSMSGGPGMSPQAARRNVDAALTALEQNERLVFILFEMEGLSGNQVAARAGCAVSRVWQDLHRARRKFRTVVEDGGRLAE
jgi:RNA polymerase sigma-70 factor (ECF subfamily)